MLLRALLFVPVFLWMRSPDVADPLKLLAMDGGTKSVQGTFY